MLILALASVLAASRQSRRLDDLHELIILLQLSGMHPSLNPEAFWKHLTDAGLEPDPKLWQQAVQTTAPYRKALLLAADPDQVQSAMHMLEAIGMKTAYESQGLLISRGAWDPIPDSILKTSFRSRSVVVCTRCGSTDLVSQELVNLNTGVTSSPGSAPGHTSRGPRCRNCGSGGMGFGPAWGLMLIESSPPWTLAQAELFSSTDWAQAIFKYLYQRFANPGEDYITKGIDTGLIPSPWILTLGLGPTDELRRRDLRGPLLKAIEEGWASEDDLLELIVTLTSPVRTLTITGPV